MSSYLIAAPQAFATASGDLTAIGEVIREVTEAAVPSTTGIEPLAADEVSAAITQLFDRYGREFLTLSTRTAAFHAHFVQLLHSARDAYAVAEATNASPLQALVQRSQDFAVISPVKDATGRPLFGNGANGAAGPGKPAATAVGFSATVAMADRVPTVPTAATAGPAIFSSPVGLGR